jgi:hypothetical protein
LLLVGFVAALAGCKTVPPPNYRVLPGAQERYAVPADPIQIVEKQQFDREAMLRQGYAMVAAVDVCTLDRNEADRDAALMSATRDRGASFVQVVSSLSSEDHWAPSIWNSGSGYRTETHYTSYGNVNYATTTSVASVSGGGGSDTYKVYRTKALVWCKDTGLAAQQLADRLAKDRMLQLSLALHQAAAAGDSGKVRALIAEGAVPNRLEYAHPGYDREKEMVTYKMGSDAWDCYRSTMRSAVGAAISRGDIAMLELLLDGMQGRSWSMVRVGDDPPLPESYYPQLEYGFSTEPFESWFDRVVSIFSIIEDDRVDLLQVLVNHGLSAADLLQFEDEHLDKFNYDYLSDYRKRGLSLHPVERARDFGAKKILAFLADNKDFGPLNAAAAGTLQPRPLTTADAQGTDALVAAILDRDHLEMQRLLDKGVDVNGMTARGWTPLTAAIQVGNRNGAARLLLHGAKPDLLDGMGQAAIHVALLDWPNDDWVWEKYTGPELLGGLVALGADPNLQDKGGYTPYQYARKKSVEDVLVGLGAKPSSGKAPVQARPPVREGRSAVSGTTSPTAARQPIPRLKRADGAPTGAAAGGPGSQKRPDLRSRFKDGKWGFEDSSGRLVIPYRFDLAMPFVDGLACVTEGGLKGYIDEAGDIVIASQFLFAESFSEGLAFVSLYLRSGYIDENSTWAIEPRFGRLDRADASSFSEGLAAARLYEDAKKGSPVGSVEAQMSSVHRQQRDA